MAHRIAELRDREEAATAPEAKQAARQAIEKLVLELWQMRDRLPGQADPDKRLERGLRVLEQLDSDRRFPAFYGDEVKDAASAVLDAHRQMSDLTMQYILLLAAQDFDARLADESALPLSDEARQYRETLETLMQRYVQRRLYYKLPGEDSNVPPVEVLLVENMLKNAAAVAAGMQAIEAKLAPSQKTKAKPGKAKQSRKGPWGGRKKI